MNTGFNNVDIEEIKRSATRAMACNLPMLRKKLCLTQTAVAQLIGVSRQTIYSIENGVRELSWANYTSLLFVFSKNDEVHALLPFLGIYPPEISAMFNATAIAIEEDSL